MSRSKKPLLEKVEITAIGSEGKALGRVEDKVVFVPMLVPGDLVRLAAASCAVPELEYDLYTVLKVVLPSDEDTKGWVILRPSLVPAVSNTIIKKVDAAFYFEIVEDAAEIRKRRGIE